jgi:hypothetical protein
MDWRDQTLLDKQMRGIVPPRHDGILSAIVACMFFVGLTLGVEFARHSVPSGVANDAVIALADQPPGTVR